MKFGGSAMAHVERFSSIAALVRQRLKRYSKIVVVVSAMGTTTDELMELARKVHPRPPKREQDMLISVGERVSMSLLAMALDLEGIQAMSFTGSQSGIITTEEHSDAKIVEVRPHRIEAALKQGNVVIVAGFQGMSRAKEITTLGRGGSDTSAVALAIALGAELVEFYKDVPGIGEHNPKTHPDTKIFKYLEYDEVLHIVGQGAEVLHHRCLEMAKNNHLKLHIHSFDQPDHPGTVIGEKLLHECTT